MSDDAGTTGASGAGVLTAPAGAATVTGFEDPRLPARLMCRESCGCAAQPLVLRRAEEA